MLYRINLNKKNRGGIAAAIAPALPYIGAGIVIGTLVAIPVGLIAGALGFLIWSLTLGTHSSDLIIGVEHWQ